MRNTQFYISGKRPMMSTAGMLHRFCMAFHHLTAVAPTVSHLFRVMVCLWYWPRIRGEDSGSPHYDVIKWKLFTRYWHFVRGILGLPVNSPHKGRWRGALVFSFIFAWTNGWVNTCDAGDMRRRRSHHDVTVMLKWSSFISVIFTLWQMAVIIWISVIYDHQ